MTPQNLFIETHNGTNLSIYITYFIIYILIYETSNRKSVPVHVLIYNVFFLNSNDGLMKAHVITLHDTYTHPDINDSSEIYL